MTKKDRINLEVKLSICLLGMSLVIIILSSLFLIDAINNNVRADRVIKMNQCMEPLFLTMEGLSFERGRTNVVLASKNVIAKNNVDFINNRRYQVE